MIKIRLFWSSEVLRVIIIHESSCRLANSAPARFQVSQYVCTHSNVPLLFPSWQYFYFDTGHKTSSVWLDFLKQALFSDFFCGIPWSCKQGRGFIAVMQHTVLPPLASPLAPERALSHPWGARCSRSSHAIFKRPVGQVFHHWTLTGSLSLTSSTPASKISTCSMLALTAACFSCVTTQRRTCWTLLCKILRRVCRDGAQRKQHQRPF